jgi:hypothetical protein
MSQRFRNWKAKFSPAFAMALLACAVAHGQDVRTNYLPGTDFSKYHTYKWVDQVPNQPILAGHPDQITDEEIRRAIDSQLSVKGFTKTDSDKADLFLAYQVGLDKETQWNATGFAERPWGPGGFGTAMGTAISSPIIIGALVLNVYDPAAKQSVWIGLATQTVDPKNAEKNQKHIDRAMQKLLKDFPPGRK